MSNEPEIQNIDMSKRSGESPTDIGDWDDSTIEFDASTGFYSVNGQTLFRCQGVALYADDQDE